MLAGVGVLAAGCVGDPPTVVANPEKEAGVGSDGSTTDDGSAACGGPCTGANEACIDGKCTCQPKTCKDLAAECGKPSNGCGGTLDCGGCSDPAKPICNANKCGATPCTPKTCQPGDCGTIDDGCSSTLSCGACNGLDTCGGGGVANKCGCTPVDNCKKNGWNCNTATDNCGGTFSCGNCAGTDTCGGGGTVNVCGCTPKSCGGGLNCGTIPDGCGSNASCGPACTGFNTCGGGGTPNVCGCTPDTCQSAGFECGTPPNGCGGVLPNCGGCLGKQKCIGYKCKFTCPYVFSFDGKAFAYETSVGGASLLGKKIDLVQGKKVEFEPMWARLDHASIDYGNGLGVVQSKLIAAEDEIVYFDAAKLTVVEHLPDYEIITSSSIQWNTLEKRDPQEIYALRTSTMRLPHSATWMSRADVTADLSTYDERAVAFDLKEDNYYDIDFGTVSDRSNLRVVIDGWKYKESRGLPADIKQVRPHLDVRQADGTYLKAIELSTPRGDKKTLAFDLSKVAFPTGKIQIRIWTGTHEDGNAMWYLDRVRLSEDPKGPITVRDIALASSNLDFVGVPSEEDSKNSAHPRIAFDDGKGELLPDHRTWGAFTRYGDVNDLLGASDDRMVVMRRGDGVTMRFEGIPRAQQGHELTVFMMTDLVFKPRKWLTSKEATPLTENVEPLPHHTMGFYPSTVPFPNDEAHQAWRRDYETRTYEKGDPRWGR
jgi:hypothetical protein